MHGTCIKKDNFPVSDISVSDDFLSNRSGGQHVKTKGEKPRLYFNGKSENYHFVMYGFH
jgi:hypothetical protein